MKFSATILVQVLSLIGTVSKSVLAAGKFRDDVHVLMYETDATLEAQSNTPLHFFTERSQLANLKTTVYGNNLDFRGFGDKYQNLRPLLEIVNKDTLIILADARDVALNVPEDEDMAIAAVDHFVENFKVMTKNTPNAVVLSAESQCCVSAMSHAHPGEYFDPVTGKRNKRACYSGAGNCGWSENENISSWVNFMQQRAFNETGLKNVADIGDMYLNAGLMAGYPKDLINLLNVMDIDPYEDDQAVLTGLMYTYPEMIILDYGQEMFGNNQWTRGVADGCVFEGHGSESPLFHLETQTQPLMIHTPGKFYACLDIIIEALGGKSQQRYHPSTRKLLTGRLSLAAQLGLGGAASATDIVESLDAPVQEEPEEAETVAPTEKSVAVEADIEEEIEIDGEETSEVEEDVPENYGAYGNYGQYGATNYGNYGQYGATNYGNYGQYGATNYGNHGQYGAVNYGNYGQYGATNYGQYGIANDGTNYGQYGNVNYGNYGQYGNANYGTQSRRGRRRTSPRVRV